MSFTYNENGFFIESDLYVRGNIMNRELIVQSIYIEQLKTRSAYLEMEIELQKSINELLKIQIEKINLKVEALWYAPNMPGYDETKKEFEKKINSSNNE